MPRTRRYNASLRNRQRDRIEDLNQQVQWLIDQKNHAYYEIERLNKEAVEKAKGHQHEKEKLMDESVKLKNELIKLRKELEIKDKILKHREEEYKADWEMRESEVKVYREQAAELRKTIRDMEEAKEEDESAEVEAEVKWLSEKVEYKSKIKTLTVQKENLVERLRAYEYEKTIKDILKETRILKFDD